jgi:D-arabinose 1-dehydrogenase-like Zn-dependent alcohol dehydrogenase
MGAPCAKGSLVYTWVSEESPGRAPKPESGAHGRDRRDNQTTICGTDLHILKSDFSNCQPGRISGHEGAGIIDKAGVDAGHRGTTRLSDGPVPGSWNA